MTTHIKRLYIYIYIYIYNIFKINNTNNSNTTNKNNVYTRTLKPRYIDTRQIYTYTYLPVYTHTLTHTSVSICLPGSRLDEWQPIPLIGGFDFGAHIEGRKTVMLSSVFNCGLYLGPNPIVEPTIFTRIVFKMKMKVDNIYTETCAFSRRESTWRFNLFLNYLN